MNISYSILYNCIANNYGVIYFISSDSYLRIIVLFPITFSSSIIDEKIEIFIDRSDNCHFYWFSLTKIGINVILLPFYTHSTTKN